MNTIYIKGAACHTYGFLPEVGTQAPQFYLTAVDLSLVRLSDFLGKTVLINVYPSIETQTCFEQMKALNTLAAKRSDFITLGVSMDLPFTLKRVSDIESLHHVKLLSDFRNRDFGSTYGLTIEDGKLAGLLARALLIIDKTGTVRHAELVEELSCPANIDLALTHI